MTAREHPIIFSAPMIRALLAGRKTMTRRLLTPGTATINGSRFAPRAPAWAGLDWSDCIIRTQSALMMAVCGEDAPYDPHADVAWWHPTGPKIEDFKCRYRVRPIYGVGDRLWVRETCQAVESHDGLDCVRYEADQVWLPIGNSPEAAEQWIALHHYRGRRGLLVPPIHMPRWASRITLEVTAVRVERLQEISEADAGEEGIHDWLHETDRRLDGWCRMTRRLDPSAGVASMRGGFRLLWSSLHTKPGTRWEDNPAVAVIQFRRLP